MKVFFERRKELAPGIWQYYFRPERRVDFIPGQYADFHILQPLDDPRGQSRVFTLTSLPSDELLSFVVKFVRPLSPYKQALQTLQRGDELRMDEAMGDLVLPKMPSIPLVFIAGGIGAASFVGMTLALTEPRVITMFYALRDEKEQIFTNVFAPLNPYLCVSPARLSAETITRNQAPDAQYYLSGSERFVEGLRRDLEALGVPHEQIVFDFFDGYIEL